MWLPYAWIGTLDGDDDDDFMMIMMVGDVGNGNGEWVNESGVDIFRYQQGNHLDAASEGCHVSIDAIRTICH